MWKLMVGALSLAAVAMQADGQSCQPQWSNQFGFEGFNNDVTLVEELDEDGPGGKPATLYVAGSFTALGDTPCNRIARLDGKIWSPVGEGLNGQVNDLATYDPDGDGATGGGASSIVLDMLVFDEDGADANPPALFVSGYFSTIGGVQARGIAKWDGTTWSAVGGSVNGSVRKLAAIDLDGVGPEPPSLVALGFFSMAGETPVNNLAAWNGTTWSALGSGVTVGSDTAMYGLGSFDRDGAGPTPPMVMVSGVFNYAGGQLSRKFGAYVGCANASQCATDMSPAGGDGTIGADDLLTIIGSWGPCPLPPTLCPADVAPANGNGRVNVDDLLAVINSWGKCR